MEGEDDSNHVSGHNLYFNRKAPQECSRKRRKNVAQGGSEMYCSAPAGLVHTKASAVCGRGRPPYTFILRSAPPPQHRRQIPHNRIPAISRIGGGVHLAAGGAEIDSAFVQRVDGHGVAQHVYVAVFLRQAFGQRLPTRCRRLRLRKTRSLPSCT